MKHLKSYKVFESIDNHISDINDILLELEDNNFSINIMKYKHKDGLSISIIYPNHGTQALDFKLSDVVDCIRRANEYMSSFGYQISYTPIILPAHTTIKGGNEIPVDINDWDLEMGVMYLAVFYSKNK